MSARLRWTCGEADLLQELGIDPKAALGYPLTLGPRQVAELIRAGITPEQVATRGPS